MITVLEYLVIAAVIGLVVFGIAVFVFGRGEQLAALSPRTSPSELPEGAIGGADVHRVRFGLALRGYRMSDVDWTLDRVAEELDRLHRRVAELGGEPLPSSVTAAGDSGELFGGPAVPDAAPANAGVTVDPAGGAATPERPHAAPAADPPDDSAPPERAGQGAVRDLPDGSPAEARPDELTPRNLPEDPAAPERTGRDAGRDTPHGSTAAIRSHRRAAGDPAAGHAEPADERQWAPRHGAHRAGGPGVATFLAAPGDAGPTATGDLGQSSFGPGSPRL